MNYLETLIDIIQQHQPAINRSEINAQSSLESLGIDSLVYIEIIFDIEQYYQLEFPDQVLADFKTIADIIDYFERSKDALAVEN